MFSTPEYVYKNGKLVVRNGKLVDCPKPDYYLDVNFDSSVENYLKKYYEKNCIGEFRNGFIAESEIDLFLDGGKEFYERFEEFKRKEMLVNGVKIFDTFAEAFPMRATRLIVTAYNSKWAMYGASSMTGFATCYRMWM